MSEHIRIYRFRLKDKHDSELRRQARAVNFVWNFCKETQQNAQRWGKKWPTAYDLHKLVAGSSKELGLLGQTIQLVCTRYATSRDAARKPFLRWRSRRSLGWRTREERRNDDNKAALAKPEPGDYWHEMFAPVSLVIAVVGGQVATFEHYKDRDPSGYSYDTDKITWRSLDDFRSWLRYDSPGMGGKTWADVARKSKRMEVIEQWRAEGGVL